MAWVKLFQDSEIDRSFVERRACVRSFLTTPVLHGNFSSADDGDRRSHLHILVPNQEAVKGGR